MTTINDIAKALNMSKTTVSLVLNHRGGELRISEASRNKVLEAAEKMQYTPNAMARAVACGETKVLAFVNSYSHHTARSYTIRILSGVLSAATELRFSVKLYECGCGSDPRIVRELLEQRVSGVIFHAAEKTALNTAREQLRSHEIPSAVVNETAEGFGIGVSPDDWAGSGMATTHLAQNGCGRILHLTFPYDMEFTRLRAAGYIETLRNVLPGAQPEIYRLNERSDFDGYDRLLDTLGAARTGVVCAGDGLAMTLMSRALRRGIRIPEQLAITGYGGLEMAEFAAVPLTTVAQPFEDMGERAAARLIEAVLKHDKQILSEVESLCLQPTLTVRESSLLLPNQIPE